MPRLCRDCGNAIPKARLKAVPSAGQCVPCLTAAGDVELLSDPGEYVQSRAPRKWVNHALFGYALTRADQD